MIVPFFSVICLAEGCGQELLDHGEDSDKDASGNTLLKDVGPFFVKEIKEFFNVRDTSDHDQIVLKQNNTLIA